jgi:hypothetical protein
MLSRRRSAVRILPAPASACVTVCATNHLRFSSAPTKWGRGTTRSVVEGASSKPAYVSSLTPLPPSFGRSPFPASRGRKESVFPRRVFRAPEFCRPQTTKRRSKSERAAEAVSSTKRLFSTRFRQKIRSGTPADAVFHARTQAACETRHGEWRLAPPSACGRAHLPAFHLRFLPAGLSSRGLSSGPGFPKTARKLRTCRTRRLTVAAKHLARRSYCRQA